MAITRQSGRLGSWAVIIMSLASAGTAFAGSVTLGSPAADTFINSQFTDATTNRQNNNNGSSQSLFIGKDGGGGIMRALIRFNLPALLTGRVNVTSTQLTLTV